MGDRVPVPGFGFLKPESSDYIHKTFQDLSEANGFSSLNLTIEATDELKCKLIVVPEWERIFPDLSQQPEGWVCPPFWDNASCIPASLAAQTAVLPCMTSYDGQTFSPLFNATRECQGDGTWGPITYYGDCLCNSTEACLAYSSNITDMESTPALEISIIIYLVGYVLSFLALCGSLTIYLSFREMRCLRHKIHMGLFCAFGLSALNWIFTKSLQSDLSTYMTMSVFDQVYCTSWVLTFFFHLASFYWMFIEGLYLFLQVQCPLSLVNIKYKHFIMIGCGGPVLNLMIWVALRLYMHDPGPEEEVLINCPFFEKTNVDSYVFEIPLFAILFSNTFFLIWIMVIVVSKLREKTAMDHDRKHWKAAKALIIVMPILGIGYLVTMVGPDPSSPWAHNIFQVIRCVLLSTQGLVISLPYCYLNTEVQTVMRTHYRRWQLIRDVGTPGTMSARASISATTAYSAVNKIDMSQVFAWGL